MKTRKTCGRTELSPELLARMADVLRLLAHADRLRIVDALDVNGSLPVHALMRAVTLAQPAASRHLNLMRKAGIIRAQRKGQEVWYEIADPRALTILGCIRKQGGGRA